MRSARFCATASRMRSLSSEIDWSIALEKTSTQRLEKCASDLRVGRAREKSRASLEAGKLGKLLLPSVHAHRTELGAAVQGGHSLARVQQRMRVERVLDGEEAGQLARTELQAHLIDL